MFTSPNGGYGLDKPEINMTKLAGYYVVVGFASWSGEVTPESSPRARIYHGTVRVGKSAFPQNKALTHIRIEI